MTPEVAKLTLERLRYDLVPDSTQSALRHKAQYAPVILPAAIALFIVPMLIRQPEPKSASLVVGSLVEVLPSAISGICRWMEFMIELGTQEMGLFLGLTGGDDVGAQHSYASVWISMWELDESIRQAFLGDRQFHRFLVTLWVNANAGNIRQTYEERKVGEGGAIVSLMRKVCKEEQGRDGLLWCLQAGPRQLLRVFVRSLLEHATVVLRPPFIQYPVLDYAAELIHIIEELSTDTVILRELERQRYILSLASSFRTLAKYLAEGPKDTRAMRSLHLGCMTVIFCVFLKKLVLERPRRRLQNLKEVARGGILAVIVPASAVLPSVGRLVSERYKRKALKLSEGASTCALSFATLGSYTMYRSVLKTLALDLHIPPAFEAFIADAPELQRQWIGFYNALKDRNRIRIRLAEDFRVCDNFKVRLQPLGPYRYPLIYIIPVPEYHFKGGVEAEAMFWMLIGGVLWICVPDGRLETISPI